MAEPLDNCPNLIRQAVQDGVQGGALPRAQDPPVDYAWLERRRLDWLKLGEMPCYPRTVDPPAGPAEGETDGA